MTGPSLSILVLIAFLAASALVLALARAFARNPSAEPWLIAVSVVAVSSVLLWILSGLGWLLDRTPALVHAGFAGLILVWAGLRRSTAVLGPPAPGSIRSGTVWWLVAIPLAGMLLMLPALWQVVFLPPVLVGVLQMTAVGAAWLVSMRRQDRVREPVKDAVAPAAHPPAQPQPTPARVEPATAPSKIFICYRREDSADVTGRIYDRLVERFGREQVFKDVDSIPLGLDFRTHLQEMVGACDVVIAVIGERWLSGGREGGRRLDDAKDFVRIELEAALQRNIPVVPVLVGGAQMPSSGDVPSTLVPLVYRHGMAVRPDPDFHHDVDRLIRGLLPSQQGAARRASMEQDM